MKRTIITLTVVLAAFVLGILLGTHRAQTFNSSVAIAAPAPAPAAVPAPPRRCPNIHGAQDALRSAEQELRDAGHDFCGHKGAAMEIIHRAIEQLRLAEDCDRCR
jgi:hypothetical protein